jgi:hypothetical protein
VQKLGQIIPVIVAAHALREGLRRNILAAVKPDLEAVRLVRVNDVVRDLVQVLDRRLRSIGVRAIVELVLVVDGNVREHSQTGVGIRPGWVRSLVAVVPETSFVGQVRRKGVVFAQRDQVVLVGQLQEEGPKFGTVIRLRDVVVDVPRPEAVLLRDRPVAAGRQDAFIGEDRCGDQIISQCDVGRSS